MIKETPIWTWILPNGGGEDTVEWREYGGKWLLYGPLDEMERLAGEIDKEVQRGSIISAKFWNASKTSAMCIYSLDRDNQRTLDILKLLGFKPTAWEYDYARRKNWTRPRFFLSAFHKLRILLETFGLIGTLRFIAGAYR